MQGSDLQTIALLRGQLAAAQRTLFQLHEILGLDGDEDSTDCFVVGPTSNEISPLMTNFTNLLRKLLRKKEFSGPSLAGAAITYASCVKRVCDHQVSKCALLLLEFWGIGPQENSKRRQLEKWSKIYAQNCLLKVWTADFDQKEVSEFRNKCFAEAKKQLTPGDIECFDCFCIAANDSLYRVLLSEALNSRVLIDPSMFKATVICDASIHRAICVEYEGAPAIVIVPAIRLAPLRGQATEVLVFKALVLVDSSPVENRSLPSRTIALASRPTDSGFQGVSPKIQVCYNYSDQANVSPINYQDLSSLKSLEKMQHVICIAVEQADFASEKFVTSSWSSCGSIVELCIRSCVNWRYETKIMMTISKMRQLTVLDLSDNHLSTDYLEPWIQSKFELPHLETLILKGNEISKILIPVKSPLLREYDISENRITYEAMLQFAREDFKKLTKLCVLDLGKNRETWREFVSIDAKFKGTVKHDKDLRIRTTTSKES